MLRRASVILGLAAALGCDGRGDAASVSIETTPLAPERARSESVAALESGHHEIQVRRSIAVPDRCRTLTGDLMRTGSELTLRVVVRPADGVPCEPEESYMAYTATIQGLRPGRYDLRVVHAYAQGRRRPEVALEHPVLVLERSVEVQ